MKMIKKIKILFLLWLALAGGLPLPVIAMTVSSQGDLRSQNHKLDALFRQSGLDDILGNIESVLQLSGDINTKALAPGQGEFARRIMHQANSAENFYSAFRKPFIENYKPQYVLSVVEWYQSPLGKKILRSGNEGKNKNSLAMELFAEKLLNSPPSKTRIALIEKIERSWVETEAGKYLYLGYVRLMQPFNKKNQKKRLGKMLSIIEEGITEPMRKIILRNLLYSYQGFNDKELAKYAGFLNSEAGHWFSQTTLQGLEKGIAKILRKAQLVQVQLLKEIAAGGPEYPLIKEIAPPGQRYLLIGKRDTFRPLLEGDGRVHSDKKEPTLKVRLFGNELKRLPPIALLVWDRIKDRHPKLYKKLIYFEGLFKNREKLKDLDEDEYSEAVEGYRNALERSSRIKMNESPLQVKYNSLKMTGIIRKKLEAVAMFEIGKTGYTVRVGDLVGPSFGHVSKIQDDQVIVVEKFRNYLGNILTNRKIIEFFQSPSKKGNKKL